MKHLFFCCRLLCSLLLSMFLFLGATPMWGEDIVVFSMTLDEKPSADVSVAKSSMSTVTNGTISGGSVSYYNSSSSDYKIIEEKKTYYRVGHNGSYYVITLSGSEKLMAGDKITISYLGNATKDNTIVGLGFTTTNTRPKSFGDDCVTTTATSDDQTLEYICTEDFVGKDGISSLYIWRYVGVTSFFHSIVITRSSTATSIRAEDVTIESNATSGEILYSINNPQEGVLPTAAILEGNWISNVQVDANNGKITFAATENTETENRVASITISYEGAEDKIVTITQKKYVDYDNPEITVNKSCVMVVSEKLMKGYESFEISGEQLSEDISLVFADNIVGLSVSPNLITITESSLSATPIAVEYVSPEAISGSTTLQIWYGSKVVKEVVVNYSSTSPITKIADVTGSMIWDFSGYSSDVTTDANNEVILANYVTLTTGDARSLKGQQQYIVRKSYCWQGLKLTFHPVVAGTVEVEWCSTSGSNYRTLAINGVYAAPQGYNSTTKKKSSANVPANQDVVLTGWNYDKNKEEYTSNQIRIWSIKFTPAVADLSVTSAEYATYYNKTMAYVMPDGLEGITVEGVNGSALALETRYEAGDAVPAGEALLLHGNEGTYTLYAATTDKTKIAENILRGTSYAEELTTGGAPYYRLSQHDGEVGFYYGAENGAAFKPGANKAYLALPGTNAPARFIFGQQGVPTDLLNVNDSNQSTKVLRDGRLYIVREGKTYDSFGRLVK